MVRTYLISFLLLAISIKGLGQKTVSHIQNNEFFRTVPVLENNQEVLLGNDILGVDDIEGHLSRGFQRLLKEDFEEALADFKKAVNVYPDIAVTYYYRGVAYASLGKQDSAMNDLRKSIELDNTLFDARLELGNILMQTGNTLEARKHFEVAKNALVDSSVPLYYLGRLEFFDHIRYYRQGNNTEHIKLSNKYLEQAISIDETFAPAYLQLGMIKLYTNEPTQSIKNYRYAIKYDSLMEEAYLGLGYAYLIKGNANMCYKTWNKLTTINPGNLYYHAVLAFMSIEIEKFDVAIVHFNKFSNNSEFDASIVNQKNPMLKSIRDFIYSLRIYNEKRSTLKIDETLVLDEGLSYLLYKKFDKALKVLSGASEDARDNEVYYLLLATAYEYNSQLDSAMINFSRAISYDSTILEAYMKRGLIYYLNGDDYKALDDFNRMLQLDTNSILGYRYRAMVRKRVKQYDKAILDYAIYLKYDSTLSDALYGRGYCKEQLGNLDGAHKDYLSALENNRGKKVAIYSKAMNGEARIALANRDTTRALEILSTIISEDIDNDEARTQKSLIHINKKEWMPAIYQLNEAINRGSVSVESLFIRGKLFTTLKYFKEAILDLTRVVDYDPKNGEAYYYRAIAYAKTRKKEKAMKDLRKAESLGFSMSKWKLPLSKPKLFKEFESMK